MNVYDITGPIRDGMWNYEPPFPTFHLKPLPQPDGLLENPGWDVGSAGDTG